MSCGCSSTNREVASGVTSLVRGSYEIPVGATSVNVPRASLRRGTKSWWAWKHREPGRASLQRLR